MNLGGVQVEPELNHTRPGNEGQRQGAGGEWGGLAALRSGVGSGQVFNLFPGKGKFLLESSRRVSNLHSHAASSRLASL